MLADYCGTIWCIQLLKESYKMTEKVAPWPVY